MKNLYKTLIAAWLLSGSIAQASLVCTADKAGLGELPLTLSIDEGSKKAVITIGTKTTQIKIDHSVWDGHDTGLITGKGLSFVYNNWYGCIRNAELLTNLRLDDSVGNIGKVTFSGCKGGSTPDDLCFPTHQ